MSVADKYRKRLKDGDTGTTDNDAPVGSVAAKYKARLAKEPTKPVSVVAPPTEQQADIEAYEAQSIGEKALSQVGNIAGGIVKGGFFDLIDAPVNLGNLAVAGINKVFGSEIPSGVLPTEGIDALKAWKAETAGRHVPKGASPVADALRTASEWGSGAIIPAGGAIKAGANVAKAIRPDVAAAVGAGVGTASDIPYAEEVLGIVGALTGGRTPKGKRPSVNNVDKKALDVINRNLQGKVEDIAPRIKAGVQSGRQGTLGDFADDKGLFGVETTLSKTPQSTLGDNIEKIQVLRQQEIIDDFGNAIPDKGRIEPLALSAEAQTAGRTQKIGQTQQAMMEAARVRNQNAVNLNRQAADANKIDISQTEKDIAFNVENAKLEQAALEATPTVSPKVAQAPTEVDAGIAGVKAQNVLKDELQEVAAQKWKVFDESPPVDITEPMTGLLGDFDLKYKTKNSLDYDKMVAKYKSEFQRIEDWKTNPAHPTEIQSVLRDVKEKVHESIVSKGKPQHIDKMMSELIEGLEGTLVATPTTSNFREAIEATKAMYDRALPERIKKTVRGTDTETFYDRMDLTGQKGASTARQLKQSDDPRILAAAEDAIRAKAKADGVDAKFLATHKGFLDEFPELQAELAQQVGRQDEIASRVNMVKDEAAVIKAEGQEALTQAKARLADSDEATDAALTAINTDAAAIKAKGGLIKAKAQKGAVAQYAQDPDKFLTKQITSTTKAGLANLKKLKSHADNNGTTEALRSHVMQSLSDTIFKPKGGLKQATGKSINDFNAAKSNLIESGILSKTEAKEMSESLDRINALQNRKKVASPIQIKETLNAMERLGTSMVAAGGATTTKSLIMGGAIKRAVTDLGEYAKNNPKILLRVEEFILNPQKYLDALDGAGTVEKATNSLVQRITGGAKGAAKGGLEKAIRFRQPYSEDQE